MTRGPGRPRKKPLRGPHPLIVEMTKIRNKLNLTQLDVHLQTGVRIDHYENGQYYPSLEVFHKLISGLGYEIKLVEKESSNV